MFWVIQNGIKMTGMPFWSHQYKGKDALSVVAYLKQLPPISAEQKRQKAPTLRPSEKGNAALMIWAWPPKVFRGRRISSPE